jgi:hypothetical protein
MVGLNAVLTNDLNWASRHTGVSGQAGGGEQDWSSGDIRTTNPLISAPSIPLNSLLKKDALCLFEAYLGVPKAVTWQATEFRGRNTDTHKAANDQ